MMRQTDLSLSGRQSIALLIFLLLPARTVLHGEGQKWALLETAFDVPAQSKDAYGNPIRKGFDPKTGWPLEIRHRATGMHFVFIPAGEFMMGSPKDEKNRDDDEGPQHKVRITRPFYLGKYEVTIAEFKAYLEATGHEDGVDWEDEDCPLKKVGNAYRLAGNDFSKSEEQPMVEISWNAALGFCEWLSKKDRVKYRLPTEAEWEYACRAGTTTAYSFGSDASDLSDYAWFWDNSGGQTHPVGKKKPNAWGLYDIHGNVWEWCSDWYDGDYYAASPRSDPAGPKTGECRVVRGGSWINYPGVCLSAYRNRFQPRDRGWSLGFRVLVGPRGFR